MNLAQLDLKPTDGDQYLASLDGHYCYIGPLLYEIVLRAKALRSPAEIVQDIRQDLSIELKIEQVQTALDSITESFQQDDSNAPVHLPPAKRSSYIHFRLKMLGGDLLNKINRPLALLFQPVLALVLASVSTLATISYYVFVDIPVVSLSTQELIAAYLVLFAVFFIHELGHAAATKYYGMRPHEISFGFYLIFPVFFADVSEAWTLNKYKRIVINLGGVYFQLLVNTLFVIAAFIYPNSPVITTILYTNLVVIGYSLLPFIRYDGYWIYSDYFDLPNLMRRSVLYPYELWNNFRNKIKAPINRPLLVYSVSSYIFFTIMFSCIGRYVHVSTEQVYYQITTSDLGWIEFFQQVEIGFIFRLTIVVFMLSFLTYRLVRYGWKKFLTII